LTKIAEGGINLSKLQSFPIPGSEWEEYSFHADMEFEDIGQFHRVDRSHTSYYCGIKSLWGLQKGKNCINKYI